MIFCVRIDDDNNLVISMEKRVENSAKNENEIYLRREFSHSNEELSAPQTKYIQDVSYLRLKNLTLGYTIPKSLLNKLKIEYLRIFFSAENILTFSNLEKDINLDPEIANDSYSGFNSGTYPMQKIYSLGINLTF